MSDLLTKMAAAFHQIMQWLVDRVLWPVVTVLPGLPYLFRKQIINEYIDLAASVRVEKADTILVTTLLDVTIKPWRSLSVVRRLLAPTIMPIPYPPNKEV